jgi:AcrR family transcriptional regulator
MKECKAAGLVTEITAKGEILEAALALARELQSFAPRERLDPGSSPRIRRAGRLIPRSHTSFSLWATLSRRGSASPWRGWDGGRRCRATSESSLNPQLDQIRARTGDRMSETTTSAIRKKVGPGRPRHDGPSPAYLARQQEIVDVAVEVFRVRGFDNANLEDVATALGASRASLYHYVPSKAHLLYLIFDRAITTTLTRLERLSSLKDPVERLRFTMRELIRTIAAAPSLFAVFFSDRPALDDAYESKILRKERDVVRLLIETTQLAAKQGALPQSDPRLTAHAILGMITWFYRWYDPVRDDPDEFADVCERMILRDFLG